MSTTSKTLCDFCGKEILGWKYDNDIPDQYEGDVGWPKSHIYIRIHVAGDVCRKCFIKVMKKHFTGDILKKIIEKANQGEIFPMP